MAEGAPVIVQPEPSSDNPPANIESANPAESAVSVVASHDVTEAAPADSTSAAPEDTSRRPSGTNAPETAGEPGQPSDGEAVEGEGAQPKKKKSEPRIVVPFVQDEIDELIKQSFSIIETECEKEEYDNGKVKVWKTMLEDYLVKKIIALDRPFKYTFYIAVTQSTGDAMDMTMGGFFQGDIDGYTTGHWENDFVQVDVAVMAFSVQ